MGDQLNAIFGATVSMCLALAAVGAEAAEKLKIGHVLPKGSQFSEAVQVMDQELQKRTAGRYSIEEYPASALGDGKAMLDGVKLGTIDMVMSSSGGALGQFNPTLGILDLMLLFRDEAHVDSVLDGPIGDKLLDSFKAQGVVGLAWGENGFRQLTNSLRPVKTPADIAGMKIRIAESEIYKKAFEALGSKPFTLPFAQVYPALKNGQAEGQENPITTIVGSKLNEVQSQITLSYHTYAPAVILINADRLGDMTPEDQKALQEAAKLGGKASRVFVRARDAKGLEALKASGIAITPTTDFDRAAFEKALAPFYAEMAKVYPMDQIQAIKNAK